MTSKLTRIGLPGLVNSSHLKHQEVFFSMRMASLTPFDSTPRTSIRLWQRTENTMVGDCLEYIRWFYTISAFRVQQQLKIWKVKDSQPNRYLQCRSSINRNTCWTL
ncbi:hypothetical protein DPMN_135138 [Dreissena polymorpha]|uniref:Uncharacterized protein n=1 Tax=Dreissena polymorpha TaxID=45954 RepID=A0A9D4JCJ7_DREPO|nr:hypothetical protein DPMN_135138 [Dreissena polymorpha]